MLPPFIIEQIRKREKEQEGARYEQPQLDIPLERPRPRKPELPPDDVERGVVILDL